MPTIVKSILDSTMGVYAGRSPQCFTFDVSDAVVEAATSAQTYICFKSTTQMDDGAYLVINGVRITAIYSATTDINYFEFDPGSVLNTATNLKDTLTAHPAFDGVILGISNPRPNEYCVVLTSCDIGLNENWDAYGVVVDAASVMPSFSVNKGTDAELLKDYKLVLTLVPSDYSGCGTLDNVQFIAPLVLGQDTEPKDLTVDLSSLGWPLTEGIAGAFAPTQTQSMFVDSSDINLEMLPVNGYFVRYSARYLAASGQAFVTEWLEGGKIGTLKLVDAKDNYLSSILFYRYPNKDFAHKWLTVDVDLQGVQRMTSPKPQSYSVGASNVGLIGKKFASVMVDGLATHNYQQKYYAADGTILGTLTKSVANTYENIVTLGVGATNTYQPYPTTAYCTFQIQGYSDILRVDYCACASPAVEVHFLNKCAGYDTILFERVTAIDYEVGQVEVCRDVVCGGVDRAVTGYDYAGLYGASNKQYNTGSDAQRFTLIATVNKAQLDLLINFKEAQQRWIYAESTIDDPAELTPAVLPRSVMVEGDSLRIFQANESYKLTVTIIVREAFY